MTSKNFSVEAGKMSLWAKTTRGGVKYLNGNIELEESFVLADKYYLSLFKNDNDGKAVMKGKITEQNDEGGYTTLAYVSLFKNEGKGEHQFYGYINPNKKLVESGDVPEINFSFKLFRSNNEPGSNRPIYTGIVYEVATETANPKVVEAAKRFVKSITSTEDSDFDDVLF